MDIKPLVSIGIPTYNRLKFLKETVESAISQSYSNIEIIISDNCSSDGTNEWLKTLTDSRIKIFTQSENIGMIPNWNKCVKESNGEYFILLSDDDYIDINFVSELITIVERHNKCFSICYGNTILVEDGKDFYVEKKYPAIETGIIFIAKFLTGERQVYPCSILFRTRDLVSNEGFSTSFPTASDAHTWMNIILQSKESVIFQEKAINYYRIHLESVSSSAKKSKWAMEMVDLLNFVLSDSQVKIHRKIFDRARYRLLVRAAYYNQKDIFSFFSFFLRCTFSIRPPLGEIAQGIFRWFIPDSFWQQYKRMMGRVGH